MSIYCLVDDGSDWVFYWTCKTLESVGAVTVSMDIDIVKWVADVKPEVVISNSPKSLAISSKCKLLLYFSDERVAADPGVRRQLALRGDSVEVFCSSALLAKKLYDSSRVKSKLQYPCVPGGTSEPCYILHHGLPGDILQAMMQEIDGHEWRAFRDWSDISGATVFVCVPSEQQVDARICLAARWGVPTLLANRGSAAELGAGWVDLVPLDANIKNWANRLRTVMRDRDIMARAATEGGKRYNSLDALVDRIKRQTAQKEAARVIPPKLPDVRRQVNHQLLQERLSERSRAALTRTTRVDPAFPSQTQQASFQKRPFVFPTHRLLPTPEWFDMHPPVDVSIIIPMFNSRTVIAEQIKNWDMMPDGLTKEIIYVNDVCPQQSAEEVLNSWNDLKHMMDVNRQFYPKGFNSRVGKIVLLNSHSGFSAACNVGAKYANGKYLVFLNADTVVTPRWVKPMVDLFNDPKVGIVGNLQLKQDGHIDGAGSQWMWDSRSFDHIGRNILEGKRLSRPLTLSEAPDNIFEVGERDMVTGCCLMIRKQLFDEIGGFDVKYRIGYWEDADLNMEVKSRGYKIMYQPDSVIYHLTGHSGASGHPYVMDNARYFYDKWLASGRLEHMVAKLMVA